MNVLRNAAKSHRLIRIGGHRNQGLSSLLRDWPRRFSTEAEQPSKDSSSDAFLQTPSTGLVYGKLFGITKHTTKSDIVNLLEGCEVSLNDIKVDYAKSFAPSGMMIQFPSRFAYDAAIRAIGRKGRLYRLDRADRSQWDLMISYDGKAVLLQGIPRTAVPDDIERFLSGCTVDASTMQIFVRQAFPDPIRMAIIHFPTKAQAMHAFMTKNRGFCLNTQILVRVLQ
ncbi:uncharacterized protein LOC130751924 [Actinidia eriantha]|uniref:uncharacterized protein LOC130751924 n=1 Tax=Actinidia eriantha TaxID=165200 RepID=UPI00258A158D|nr:uncharacterized protein LOC130751924 [Actinidia eriantha]